SLHAMCVALGLLAAPLPLAARTPCNPPRLTCDAGDGITYRCPPCRPQLQQEDPVQDGRERLETYRNALEAYRRQLEASRSLDPGGALEGYREGIDSYRDGIDSYREGQAAARAPSAGER